MFVAAARPTYRQSHGTVAVFLALSAKVTVDGGSGKKIQINAILQYLLVLI